MNFVYFHFNLLATGFGYANQRIVREIRIDTFLSILKQDIGFFDSQTSGELASRLNSDCGEMAGDLVSPEHWPKIAMEGTAKTYILLFLSSYFVILTDLVLPL